jgi:hypothetical protein
VQTSLSRNSSAENQAYSPLSMRRQPGKCTFLIHFSLNVLTTVLGRWILQRNSDSAQRNSRLKTGCNHSRLWRAVTRLKIVTAKARTIPRDQIWRYCTSDGTVIRKLIRAIWRVCCNLFNCSHCVLESDWSCVRWVLQLRRPRTRCSCSKDQGAPLNIYK